MKRLLVAVCALLAAGSAAACSCEGPDEAGFIHASLDRLPANARGALFQLPYDSAITLNAAAFLIVSDRHPKPIKGEISWPRLGIEQAGQLRERILARIGPVGGFQPGARYTITYLGKPIDGRYPTRAEFTVDTVPLDIGSYQLALASAPARRLLPLPGLGGACSTQQGAIAADVAYRIPDHYTPYRSAMIYISATQQADGAPSLLGYAPSLCAPWTLDTTAGRGGLDLIHASCTQPGPPVTVHGHAGLLEVEDQLQLTNTLQIDFDQAPGQACTGYAMLNEAIARADSARVKQLACAVAHEELPDAMARRPTWQSLLTLLKLRRVPNGPPPACLNAAAARWRTDLWAVLDRIPGVGYLHFQAQNLAEAFTSRAPSPTPY